MLQVLKNAVCFRNCLELVPTMTREDVCVMRMLFVLRKTFTRTMSPKIREFFNPNVNGMIIADC